MEVNGPGNVQGPDPIHRKHISAAYAKSAGGVSRIDCADISDVARLKALLKDVPDIRLEKVERIRAAIADGTYETPEKIDTVIDRLLEEL